MEDARWKDSVWDSAAKATAKHKCHITGPRHNKFRRCRHKHIYIYIYIGNLAQKLNAIYTKSVEDAV